MVAADVDALAGCDAAFVLAEHAADALDAGVDEVLALSGHPLGAPATGLPALVADYAREVPGHGDHWGGPSPGAVSVEVAGAPVRRWPGSGSARTDRVLVAGSPAEPAGLAGLLAVLCRRGGPRAGAGTARAGPAAARRAGGRHRQPGVAGTGLPVLLQG